MASEMVERLAKKWERSFESPSQTKAADAADARWWLNAIADELDPRHMDLRFGDLNPSDMARWLRTQAESESP